MSASSSYILPENGPETSDQDEIDSLPSSIDSSELGSEDDSDAQREWEASLQQLELILTMVVVPYAGKYFGRRFAYWSWAKYMEWLYDVDVKITNKAAFNTAGLVGAAQPL
ncbi:hypothetical protein F5884DRAFT_783673 [Xylogone sp. PMI_703]|nr:hypothetical protein F5884DRAFT_783673 [Xylogone sp. PMI_703]